MEKRIVLNELVTFEEMNDFGINNRGTYSSQSGHDDVAMTCINLVPLLESDTFADIVEEIYESVDSETKKLIQTRLDEGDSDSRDESFSYLKDIM